MDSRGLTDRQIDSLKERVRRDLKFLGNMIRRMDQLGFPPNDRLYLATTKAFQGAHELHVELHYLSCKGGVCR